MDVNSGTRTEELGVTGGAIDVSVVSPAPGDVSPGITAVVEEVLLVVVDETGGE